MYDQKLQKLNGKWEPAETGSPDHHRLDESRLAIPRRVGLHQSPLPLHQPRPFWRRTDGMSSKIHQTASVPMAFCLNEGVHPKGL
jgi:hypothetical protein